MSTQIQCPNCSGYRVGIQNTKVIAIEERKRYAEPFKLYFWPFVVVLFISILAALIWHVGGIIIGVILILVQIAGVLERVKKGTLGWYIERVPTIIKYDYYCHLCGYSWSWQSNDPLPEVHIRPDLIANGAQKLEQEEEQRRKDAAALYYLTHQGKK
jgi:hypothetical protein